MLHTGTPDLAMEPRQPGPPDSTGGTAAAGGGAARRGSWGGAAAADGGGTSNCPKLTGGCCIGGAMPGVPACGGPPIICCGGIGGCICGGAGGIIPGAPGIPGGGGGRPIPPGGTNMPGGILPPGPIWLRPGMGPPMPPIIMGGIPPCGGPGGAQPGAPARPALNGDCGLVTGSGTGVAESQPEARARPCRPAGLREREREPRRPPRR